MAFYHIFTDDSGYVRLLNLNYTVIGLQKAYRLADRSDFSKVYRYGKSMANRQFVVYSYKNSEVEHFRLGISVSKKVGKAVVRNRMRRVIKEVVRHLAPRIEQHVDLVIVVRRGALELDYDGVSKSLVHVLSKAQVLHKQKRSPSRVKG